MTEITVCPEPTCQAPEVLDRFDMWSTDGPVEHVSTRCMLYHTFTVPADRTYDRTSYRTSAPNTVRGGRPS
jgi:hypothetical protein